MNKAPLSVITLIMLLAFMPYNLQEGPGLKKVTAMAAETYDNHYLKNEFSSLKATYRHMRKAPLFASAGGVFVIILLLIILL